MPRKLARKTKAKEEMLQENLVAKNSIQNKSSVNLPKPLVSIIIVLVILLGIAYFFRGLFVAAIVNGQPITHLALVQELEKQGGKQTLNSLVTKALILQEAQKKNVTVSDKEINDEIKKINDSLAKQGQRLDQLLVSRNMTKADLIDQIKTQKLVEKMLGSDIQVSDKEVDAYIQANKESFPEGSISAEMKNNVKDQIKQQKLSQKFQAWLAELQKNANIIYFVNF